MSNLYIEYYANTKISLYCSSLTVAKQNHYRLFLKLDFPFFYMCAGAVIFKQNDS
jgi:hypothetical protein